MTTVGLLLGLLGCGPGPLPVAIGPEGAIPLARTRNTTEIVLPETNRPTALPPRVEILGRLQERRRGKTWVEYQVRMPFRSVYLGHSASRQPRGLRVRVSCSGFASLGSNRNSAKLSVGPGSPLRGLRIRAGVRDRRQL